MLYSSAGSPATPNMQSSSEIPGGASVTWLGHATAVAELGSARVIFDPLLPWRARAAGAVDAILVTHSHVDHLNRWSLKAIDRSAHLVVPRGSAPIVADLGFAKLTEVSAGDQLAIGDVAVEAVATRHDNGRWRKRDAPECVGYVISGGGVALHHAGDVDFSDHAIFDDIGKRMLLAWAEGVRGLRDERTYSAAAWTPGAAFETLSKPAKLKTETSKIGRSPLLGKR